MEIFSACLVSCPLNLSFFLHFSKFFSRSQFGKTWDLNWEKKILFCIGNGAQIRQIESLIYNSIICPVKYETILHQIPVIC